MGEVAMITFLVGLGLGMWLMYRWTHGSER